MNEAVEMFNFFSQVVRDAMKLRGGNEINTRNNSTSSGSSIEHVSDAAEADSLINPNFTFSERNNLTPRKAFLNKFQSPSHHGLNESIEMRDLSRLSDYKFDISKNNLYESSNDSIEPQSSRFTVDEIREALTDCETHDESGNTEMINQDDFEHCDDFWEDDILQLQYPEDGAPISVSDLCLPSADLSMLNFIEFKYVHPVVEN